MTAVRAGGRRSASGRAGIDTKESCGVMQVVCHPMILATDGAKQFDAYLATPASASGAAILLLSDMFGLNDLHIGHLQVPNMGEKMAGHEKTDPEYVLDKQPDYMMKYEQNIGYFDSVANRLSNEYSIISIRTASGWPTLLLHRNGAP